MNMKGILFLAVGILAVAVILLVVLRSGESPERSEVGIGTAEPLQQVIDFDELLEQVWDRLEPQLESLKTEQDVREVLAQMIEEMQSEGILPQEQMDVESLIDRLVEALTETGKLTLP